MSSESEGMFSSIATGSPILDGIIVAICVAVIYAAISKKRKKSFTSKETEQEKLQENIKSELLDSKETEQEKLLMKSFADDASTKRNIAVKKYYITIIIAAVVLTGIIVPYSLYVTSLIGEEYRLVLLPPPESLECSNDKGLCYETILLEVIDGDTIKTVAHTPIRFALASAPELSDEGGQEAKEFIKSICPVGSSIIIDQDDSQIDGNLDKITANVICNGKSLNESLIENNHGTIDTRFCNSEFAQESWVSTCN